MPDWQYNDWMGWHEQGDGKLFLGINVEQVQFSAVKSRSSADFLTLVALFDSDSN